MRSETEPGQELLPSKKSSHDQIQSSYEPEPSHELAKDESELDQKIVKKVMQNSAATIVDEDDYDPRLQSSSRHSSSPASNKTSLYEFIGDLENVNGEAIFIDGSRYQGTWDSLGMAGAGSYAMPHDVLYEGQMKDGMQHGKGSLVYPGKQVINGVWNRGELEKLKYIFNDGLEFETENWNYCRFPDRRFYRSKIKGLNPAGRSFKTQDQPTKIIPLGCYDSGDGIFDPSNLCVTNFERPSKIIRIPWKTECQWIKRNCRKGGIEPTGYRPWLNENWSDSDPPELPYRLPMSNDSPEKWWRRIFTFDKDSNVILNEMRRSLLLLEKDEDEFGDYDHESRTVTAAGLDDHGKVLGSHPECFCLPEKLETGSEFDVCGADRISQDLSKPELDYLREVFCEKMDYSDPQEYEGEYDPRNSEDLLMTVCCPPESTILRRRRDRESSRSFVRKESMMAKELSEIPIGSEESFEIDHDNWEAETEMDRELYYFDEDGRSEKSMKGEISEDEDFGPFIKAQMKLEKGPIVKKLKPKKIRTAKKKQIRCPDLTNTEQLLQRKVGDLLFSPALEAPRSPVYLVRKDCDNKTCSRKLKSGKYDHRKCGGVSSSPGNLPSKKRNPSHICKEDKKFKDKLNSQYKHICHSNTQQFITIDK